MQVAVRFGGLALIIWLSGCGAPQERPAQILNVVLVTVDSLRADHLGCYGHELRTSPTIDKLASRGVRFADASAHWPKTAPSVASLLTGTYPATHGVLGTGSTRLDPGNVTLAEVLKGGGYRTAAVVGSSELGRQFSFEQGFDDFVESWKYELVRQTGSDELENGPGATQRYTNATIVTDQALSLLPALREAAPFFLWVHYVDPHGPYKAPREYARHFERAYPAQTVPLEVLPAYQVLIDAAGLPVQDLGRYKAHYDREIRYVDDELARLMGGLSPMELSQRTLVVLTADHGESLGEHRYYLDHGAVPYQTNAHVPLIMTSEGLLPPGVEIGASVGLIDVAPTILDLAHLEIPRAVQGRSLLDLIGGSAPERYVFIESGEEADTQLSVRRDQWKLVDLRSERDRTWLRRPRVALYDVEADPLERSDVASLNPTVVEELQLELETWRTHVPSLDEPR